MGKKTSIIADLGKLDRQDMKILKILSKDGRLTVTKLAERVGLSKSPCQMRLKRLLTDGYIRGFRAVLDPAKLGVEQVAFIEVKLTDTTEPALRAFNEAVRGVPEIEMCHMIAGAFDYLLKVRTKDMKNYREVLGETVSSLPYVGSTSTHISMESVKDSAY